MPSARLIFFISSASSVTVKASSYGPKTRSILARSDMEPRHWGSVLSSKSEVTYCCERTKGTYICVYVSLSRLYSKAVDEHEGTSARGSIAGANFSALYPAAATCTCKSSQMLCDSLAQLGRAVGWMRRQVARMLPTPVGRRSVDSSLLSHSTKAE